QKYSFAKVSQSGAHSSGGRTSWTPRAFSRKCAGCALLRRLRKSTAAKRRTTRNVAGQNSALTRRKQRWRLLKRKSLDRQNDSRFNQSRFNVSLIAFADDPEAEIVARKAGHIRAAHCCS